MPRHTQYRQRHTSSLCQLRKSLSFGLLFTVGFSSSLVASVRSDSYLKEAPSFLTPCALSDPKNGACLARAFENVYTNWKEGVPGLKNIGSLDPFHVKKVHAEQKIQNIDIQIDLRDVVITGLSATKVTKASIDGDYTLKFLLKTPFLRSKGNYRMKGTILVLNLDSAGTMETEISDLELVVILKTKLLKINNRNFFDVTSLKSSVKNIGNLHTQYNNLFNDNAELNESANNVFNQNWREIFELTRPALEETIDAISFGRYKKIFKYVPADYFFVDLP